MLSLSFGRYHPRDSQMNSETFHYKRGANQVFSQSLHVIEPTKFPEEDVCCSSVYWFGILCQVYLSLKIKNCVCLSFRIDTWSVRTTAIQ